MTLSFKDLFLVLGWLFFCVAHLFFLKFFLYWNLAWLDTLMHLWGGVLLVSTWYRFLAHKKSVNRFNHPLLILFAFIIAWEIFKYAIGSTVSDNYVFDTALDIVAGFSGGLITFFYKERYSVQ